MDIVENDHFKKCDDKDDDHIDSEEIESEIKTSHFKATDAGRFEIKSLNSDEFAGETKSDTSSLLKKYNNKKRSTASSRGSNSKKVIPCKVKYTATPLIQSETLPIDSYFDEIIARVTRDRVTIIHGGTLLSAIY